MDAELHYLTYDPEAMYAEMVVAYMDAGGKPLYAGDEKEMLLRGMMANFMQTYAAFDHAARMQTLRYATGDYLDMIGEKRGIARIDAVKATGKISILVQRSISPIPAGTLFTDGARTYATMVEVSAPAGTGTFAIEAAIECTQAGAAGNAMMQGMALYQVVQNAKILSVTVTQTTMGGVDAEEDEAYRERIREGGFYGATTGPKGAYESKAMEVSASIVDAGAYRVSTEVGVVGIALILKDGLTASEIAAIKNSVQQALSEDTVRPLTDTVQVDQAVEVSYTLKIAYRADGVTAENILAKLHDAAAEYQVWQENTVGRAFDPYKLLSMLYNAGATRAEWTTGSVVNGNAVAYTPIAANERLRGTVTLEEMEI